MSISFDLIGAIGEPAAPELSSRVVRFLHYEASLVDDKRLDRWIELFTDDLEYRAPIRVWRDDAGYQVDPVACYFNDTKQTLSIRIQRISTGLAWAESPPSVTRHFVSNVRVTQGPGPDELTARANVLVTRSRGPSVRQEVFPADRFDILRPDGDSFQIARRIVILDSSMPDAQNLAIFF